MQRTKRTKKFILFLVISIATIIFLFPIYWVIITAFKNRGMIYTLPPIFFPAGFTFDNFVEAFQTKPLLLWRRWLDLDFPGISSEGKRRPSTRCSL